MGLVWLTKPVLWHSVRGGHAHTDPSLTEYQIWLTGTPFRNVGCLCLDGVALRSPLFVVVHRGLELFPDDCLFLLRCNWYVHDRKRPFTPQADEIEVRSFGSQRRSLTRIPVETASPYTSDSSVS